MKINDNGLVMRCDFLQYHLRQSDKVEVGDKIKKLFFRCRLYFRLRKLNKTLIVAKNQKKKNK